MHRLAPAERTRVVECLLQGAGDARRKAADERWNWLMAAHVVGQYQVGTHLDTHRRMLALAWETQDWREFAGQLLRLALLPLGHVLGTLPAGNVGRSTVPITRPMDPPEPVQVLIDWAVLGTRIPGTGW